MAKLYNLARMTTATTGTGTITLGVAVSGFLSFALAGVADGDTVSYGISDGAGGEVGTGVYAASGTTLSRTPTFSTNGNAAISLSGTAQVFITARAEDFASLVTVGEVKFVAFNRVPPLHLACDGAQVSRTSYAALFAALVVSNTVTITQASPAVVTWSGNQLRNGDPILLTTTGALPTGLATATKYFVVSNGVDGTDKFRLAASPGGAAINTSSAGSGTQTATNAPWEGTAIGNGSTTFTLPDLRGDFIRGIDNGAGVDTNRSMGGGVQLDALQSHTHNVVTYSVANFYNETNAGSVFSPQYGLTPWTTTDGSGRMASETRPRNAAMLGVIRYAAAA